MNGYTKDKLNRVLAIIIFVLLVAITSTYAHPSSAVVTAATGPAVTEPAVTAPAVSDPAVTEPAMTTPAVSGPAVTEPIPPATGTAVSGPAVTGAAVVRPATQRPQSATPPSATGTALPATYAAFTSSVAATLYLPGTKMIRQQPIRTYLDRTKPMVALTFDDGPSQYTEHVVDLLRRYNCRATFCMLGNRIRPQADRVRLVAAQGSEIVGHSWDHQSLPGLSKKKIKSELNKTNNAIEAVTGVRPALYRPPYGAISKNVRKVSKKQRLAILTWSFDSEDWKSRDTAKIFKRIKKNVKDGQIILLHDIHEPTTESVDRILPWLISKGYQPVTVSELFYYKGITIKPGVTYNDGA
jgi:peptidoglycan/xylan/chitin deacetylase (PgdA/CDA1 family)